MHANLRGQRLDNDVNALDVRGTRNQSPRRRRRLGQAVGRRRVFVKAHQIVTRGTQRHTHIGHPVVHGLRLGAITQHGLSDRAYRIGLNAAVVAGHQHAPLGKRHKQRVKHLELDRQLNRLAIVLRAATCWTSADCDRIAADR